MMMAGHLHPPFSFWSCQKENGPCTVQKKKTLGRELGRAAKFRHVRELSPPGLGEDLGVPAGARRTGSLVGVFPRVKRLPTEAVGRLTNGPCFSFRASALAGRSRNLRSSEDRTP